MTRKRRFLVCPDCRSLEYCILVDDTTGTATVHCLNCERAVLSATIATEPAA